MASAKRGGVRRGAGRKPVLGSLQRLQVGAMVHDALQQETQDRFDRALDARIAEDEELPQIWARLGATPRRGRRDIDPESLAILLADAQAAIEEGVLQGRRYFPGPGTTAPGVREPILRRVARDVSRRWKKRITPRMVEKCLEEYRATMRTMDVQLACEGITALLRWLGAMPGEPGDV
jgi:hypothetical protein